MIRAVHERIEAAYDRGHIICCFCGHESGNSSDDVTWFHYIGGIGTIPDCEDRENCRARRAALEQRAKQPLPARLY